MLGSASTKCPQLTHSPPVRPYGRATPLMCAAVRIGRVLVSFYNRAVRPSGPRVHVRKRCPVEQCSWADVLGCPKAPRLL